MKKKKNCYFVQIWNVETNCYVYVQTDTVEYSSDTVSPNKPAGVPLGEELEEGVLVHEM